jgi:hypothetical protein
MTSVGAATTGFGLLRRAVRGTCACAAHSWKVVLSRSLAGVVVSAEVRSR